MLASVAREDWCCQATPEARLSLGNKERRTILLEKLWCSWWLVAAVDRGCERKEFPLLLANGSKGYPGWNVPCSPQHELQTCFPAERQERWFQQLSRVMKGQSQHLRWGPTIQLGPHNQLLSFSLAVTGWWMSSWTVLNKPIPPTRQLSWWSWQCPSGCLQHTGLKAERRRNLNSLKARGKSEYLSLPLKGCSRRVSEG